MSEESTLWFEEMRLVLLSEGFGGMERELMKLRKGLRSSKRKAVDSLLRYLEGNKNRMNDCERLRAGRVIGSGSVEGACKNLVGRRLKQTGACWRLDRVNKMASIVRICKIVPDSGRFRLRKQNALLYYSVKTTFV